MTTLTKAGTRTRETCPLCDQPRLTRSQATWRRIRTWVLYGWIVGLGVLAAEIVIEAQMISRQWELFDRTVKLLDLKVQTARGR